MNIFATDPCPCGSPRTAGDCCLRKFPVRQADGRLVEEAIILVPSTRAMPPDPRTGKQVAGCYASCLADCDGPLTHEHFISHQSLKRLAGEPNMLYARGVDPARPDWAPRIPTKTITALVLCRRHNGALKPFDDAGNRFFDTLAELPKLLASGSPKHETAIAVSGPDFERWCLKALCGFVARTGRPVLELWVRILFGERDIVRPRGLFVFAAVGDTLSGNDIMLEELIDQDKSAMGLSVRLLNHEVVLSMHPEVTTTLARHVGKFSVRRPGLFLLTNQQTGSAVHLALSWPDFDEHRAIISNWTENAGVLA